MAQTFGQALRELRRSRNATQRELASKVGVDFSYISKVENDRLPPPSADTIVRICKALSVSSGELLAMTGKMPSQVRQMIGGSPAALKFVQQAHELELTEEEWKKLADSLKRLRGRRKPYPLQDSTGDR